MKKNVLMISIIAALFVGTLFVMNKTHANGNANVTLGVTSGAFSCSTYPTAVSMGNVATAASTGTLSADSWTNSFTCVDLKGTWGSQLIASSSALTGTTTGVIASVNITWTPAGTITQTAGNCVGLTLGAGGTLNTSRTIIQKAGLQTCSFTYAPDGMSILVPPYTPVNAYTAVMTITDPS